MTRLVESQNAEIALLRKQLADAQEVIETRKKRTKGKRVKLQGQFVFSSEEVLKMVREAEEKPKEKKPRGRPRKRPIEELEEETEEEEPDSSSSDLELELDECAVEAINSTSHVFDAEAIGALKGLQCALEILQPSDGQLWMCIDSTSVIWCMRANAPNTSQWAFLECHTLIDRYKVGIIWSPGHMGIEGNEMADELADAGANEGRMDNDHSAEPTISGIATPSLTASVDTRKPFEHLVFCEISQRKFHAWPAKPDRPPSRPEEGRKVSERDNGAPGAV
ncbi:hypothetical protein DID88_007097 [Monilinia fructigena]|uniref:Uncharacterized protein n=1 Tax=Monilinia fructigena TaxID=38457 RepID=A0A395J7Y7_9HELO|nr:hypothetical protein DID88_007097 [Monilinia fructigena]